MLLKDWTMICSIKVNGVFCPDIIAHDMWKRELVSYEIVTT
jgi:hypothetical protein